MKYELICDGELVLGGDDTLAVVFNNLTGANFKSVTGEDYKNYMLTNGLGTLRNVGALVLMGDGPVATGRVGLPQRVTHDDICQHETSPKRDSLTWPEAKFPAQVGAVDTLRKAIEFVLANLPPEIELAAKCQVEKYARAPRHPGGSVVDGGVFAYQFMSTQGANIATWIPEVCGVSKGPTLLPGLDGWGRQFDCSLTRTSEYIVDTIKEIQAETALREYPDSDCRLSDVYDDDAELQRDLCIAFPGFEYPDFAHKTIAQIVRKLPEPLDLQEPGGQVTSQDGQADCPSMT